MFTLKLPLSQHLTPALAPAGRPAPLPRPRRPVSAPRGVQAPQRNAEASPAARASTGPGGDLAARARIGHRDQHLAWQALREDALAQALALRADARQRAGQRLWAWLVGG